MNQVYDPMRYVDRTGEGVAQIGAQAANTLGNFFQQNAQWKQFKANQKSDDDAKMSVYNTTLKLLQEKGIDPAQINIPAPTDKRITPEDYTAKLAESIQHVFVGSGAKLDQGAASQIGITNQPGVQENLAKQSFLDQNDPLNQINLNGKAGTPAPAGIPVSNSQEQISPMLADITGAQQSAPAPQEDEVGKYFDPLAKALIEDVRGGRLSAQAASTEMKDILKLKAQANLSKVQKERDDAKATQRERDRMWEATVSGALGSNKVTTPGGGPVTKENISQVEIGNKLPKEFSPGSGGGRRDEKQKLDEQKFLYDKVKDTETRAIRMYGGKDEFGEPATYDQAKYDNVMTEAATNKMALTLHTAGLDLSDAQSQAATVMNAPFSYDQPTRGLPITKDSKTGKWALSLQYPGILEKLAQASRNGLTANDVLQDMINRVFPSSMDLNANKP
jgi:hypothetical protein